MAQWPTASMSMTAGYSERENCESSKKAGHVGNELLRQVIKHGQAAPASSNTGGSRQGLWLTPRANEPDSDPNFAARNADRGAHCHGTLSSQAKETWWTRQCQDSKHSGTNPSANGERMLLANQVNWATPATRDTQGKREAAANARKGNPLDTLPNQMAQWGAPTARDHKSGRGNEEREYKELTPMVERQQSGKLNPRWVETLMGLPIGWTMPSCTSPVTIAPTSCGSLGTESCQPPQSERGEFLLAS
jgi:hypothetical protein